MSFELDPKEVLMHLHGLGYYNITPQQLDEFIKDLKKLIKYEVSKKKMTIRPPQVTEDSMSSTLPNTTDESMPSSPPPQPSTANQKHHSHHNHPGCSSNKSAEQESSSSSESSVPPVRRILRECSKHASQKNQQKEDVQKEKRNEGTSVAPKSSKSCDCMWRRIGCKCCDENWSKEQHSIKTAKFKENLAPRPKSSFIRSWQLTGQPRPGSAPQRSDPVALYHQYQQVWKQQKLPGENNHNDLRWIIRERMLGQEPHPRPLSQASSVTSVGRQRKRL